MKQFSSQYGQVLIIYLTTLFVGGSSLALGIVATGKSINDLEKSVTVHVLDMERQNRALALLEEWNDEGKSLRKAYTSQRERLFSLIKDHNTSESAFNKEMNQLLAMDKSASDRLLDIQYRLRNNMTSSEWDRVMSNH